MTETRTVSIEEVRTLVAERQRYEDWLTALESKRAQTPVRVFERVRDDYVARRRGVMERLHEHVGGLSAMADDFDSRLGSLESQLGTLEDERAEAMLRTEVGEFDADRWERVKQDVEVQISQLGEQRTGLLAEVDEVRKLLASARREPEVAAHVVAEVEQAIAAVDTHRLDGARVAQDGMGEIVTNVDTRDAEDALAVVTPFQAEPRGAGLNADGSVDELSELDNALSLFGGASNAAPNGTPNGGVTGLPSSLSDVDVFDDAELGDLRMAPPVRSTATATPPASPNTGAPAAGAGAPSAGGFDDLAFLRSVVDPTASSGVTSAAASSDQQKTLRCTECGTMNFPTEWYCERCGGELAAF